MLKLPRRSLLHRGAVGAVWVSCFTVFKLMSRLSSEYSSRTHFAWSEIDWFMSPSLNVVCFPFLKGKWCLPIAKDDWTLYFYCIIYNNIEIQSLWRMRGYRNNSTKHTSAIILPLQHSNAWWNDCNINIGTLDGAVWEKVTDLKRHKLQKKMQRASILHLGDQLWRSQFCSLY